MRKTAHVAIILLGSFAGGLLSEPAVGLFHRAQAQVVAWIGLVGSVTSSGAQGPSNASEWINATISGTATDAFSSPANALITTETINDTGAGSVDGLLVDHSFGGSNIFGGRTGAKIRLQQTATTSNTAAQSYVGLSVASWGEANDTGTLGSPVGSIFGGNIQCILNGNATFFNRCAGAEIDVTVAAGANVANKLGLEIVQATADAVAGTSADIGLSIANHSGAPGWTCGFCIGTSDAVFSVSSAGTIIGCWGHAQTAPGTSSCGTALNGIDWSGVTFAAGGAPIVLPLITPASSSTTCKAGSIEWDANFVYICTATNTFKRATLATF